MDEQKLTEQNDREAMIDRCKREWLSVIEEMPDNGSVEVLDADGNYFSTTTAHAICQAIVAKAIVSELRDLRDQLAKAGNRTKRLEGWLADGIYQLQLDSGLTISRGIGGYEIDADTEIQGVTDRVFLTITEALDAAQDALEDS